MYKNYFLLFIFLLWIQLNLFSQQQKYALVIHGGAGMYNEKSFDKATLKKHENTMHLALDAGEAVLQKGGHSKDAIIAAIVVLENSPLFNAGKGAVVNEKGKAELDASIMNGSDLNAGAVAGVKRVKNPILAAAKVMDTSEHVMLGGKGADKFAALQGLQMVKPSYFITKKRKRQFKKALKANKNKEKYGTVGAVAIDKHGNIAAATSTGGMMMKKFGRIGDSPVIAAGTYADNNTCGVSCTGHGEFFIRNVVAYDMSALMKYANYSLEEAAKEIIHQKLKKQNAKGGLIAIDKEGNICMEYNTANMFKAYIDKNGLREVLIF